MKHKSTKEGLNIIKRSYGNAAIYTRKTAFYEKDKELNDNLTQRLICTVTVKFNIEDEISVLLKRYDENRYVEDDIDNRPVLKELFKDIKDGLVDTVAVYSMNILSANLKTVDKIVSFFKAHKVRIILAHERVDTFMPSGRRFFLQIAELAHFEKPETKGYFLNE